MRNLVVMFALCCTMVFAEPSGKKKKKEKEFPFVPQLAIPVVKLPVVSVPKIVVPNPMNALAPRNAIGAEPEEQDVVEPTPKTSVLDSYDWSFVSPGGAKKAPRAKKLDCFGTAYFDNPGCRALSDESDPFSTDFLSGD
jgi:hypothetical protein